MSDQFPLLIRADHLHSSKNKKRILVPTKRVPVSKLILYLLHEVSGDKVSALMDSLVVIRLSLVARLSFWCQGVGANVLASSDQIVISCTTLFGRHSSTTRIEDRHTCIVPPDHT